MDKKKYYIHQGQDGPVWFDIEEVKKWTKLEFVRAHKLPGAANLYHAITGYPNNDVADTNTANANPDSGNTANTGSKKPKREKDQ